MKKFICILLALTLCVAGVVFIASAASATATLSGPNTVRAGDTITLSFKLNGDSLLGASGTLSYDSSQLTLTGTKQKIASPWMVEFEGNNFVAYDNALSSPIKKSTELFTATFKVKSLSPGTTVNVSFTSVTASDGSADINVGTVSYSVKIAEPLSTDNNLTSLNVKNATISPKFDPKVTSYTAEVPFSVSKLEIDAKGADKSKVTIDNPNLVADATTSVKITVKAENGDSKTYTIKVKRAQDPNYVPSGNNKLSNISVSGFLLSPVFSADKTEYVIWLPYETENVTVSGTAADSKASVEVIGGKNLTAGKDNTIKVICTAENGDKLEYIVVAKRAAPHGEVPSEPETSEIESEEPIVSDVVSEVPDESIADESEVVVSEAEESEVDESVEENSTADPIIIKQGIPVWLFIVSIIVCLGGGAVGGYAFKNRK